MGVRSRHDFYEPQSENGYIQLRSSGFFIDAQTFLKLQREHEEQLSIIEEERTKAEKRGEDDLDNDPDRPSDRELLDESDDNLLPQMQPLADPTHLRFDVNYRIALSSFVEKTMSDLTEYCQTGDGVRVFTCNHVLHACENLQYDSEKADRFKPVIRKIALNNGFRTIHKPNEALFEALDKLKLQFPNFVEVVDHFIGEFQAWSVLPPQRWTTFPVLLNGVAGLGKTAFAKALARTLGVPFYFHNLGGTSAGFILNGSGAQWGSSKEGLLLKSFAQSDRANPLFLFDEIDKKEKNDRFQIEPVLLELLEPETSSSMTDEYANLSYNAAHGIYIATCNDLSAISKPLLSRFEVFTIASPHKSQRIAIVRNMAQNKYPELEFEEESIKYLARVDVNLRVMHRLIRRSVAVYAAHKNTSQGQSINRSDETPAQVSIFHVKSALKKSGYSNLKLLEWGD